MTVQFKIPNENIIKLENNEKTTLEIIKLINYASRIIIIVDETSKIQYNINTLIKPNLYKIITKNLMTEKFVIPAKKFCMLVKQALIKKENFDIVVFRLNGISKELAEAFKIFYYKDLSPNDIRPLVVSYLSEISNRDDVYLHSKIENNLIQKKLKNLKVISNAELYNDKIVTILFSHAEDNELNEYLFYRQCLFNRMEIEQGKNLEDLKNIYDTMTTIENVSFKFALYYIKEFFSIQYNENEVNIKQDPNCTIKNQKFRRAIEIIKENANKKIYFFGATEQLIDYLYAESDLKENLSIYNDDIKIDKDSILIVYNVDKMKAITNGFHKIFIFIESYDENERIIYNDEESLLIDALSKVKLNSGDQFCEISKVISYMKKEIDCFVIENSNACINYNSSYEILQNFIFLLQSMLKDEYFFLKNPGINSEYKERKGSFSCTITLPYIHDQFEKITGEYKTTKVEARKSAAMKTLQFLHKKELMDDYLCPIKVKFVDKNVLYYQFLCRTFKIKVIRSRENLLESLSDDFDFKCTTSDNSYYLSEIFYQFVETYGCENDKLKALISKIKDNEFTSNALGTELQPHKIKTMFEKKYGITLSNERKIITSQDINVFERKQPECLKSFPNTYYVYTFKQFDLNDSKSSVCELGICTGKSFEEKLKFQNIEIEFVEKMVFTEEEIECLMFFQVVLFYLNFKRIKESATNTKDYCYFLVPIKNKRLDKEYLMEFMSTRFIIQNVYQNDNEEYLKENLLFNVYNKNFYVYKGPSDKKIDKVQSFNQNNKTFLEYYEEKYNVKLLITEGEGLLFEGYPVDKKIQKVPNILSSEIVQITSIKRKLIENFNYCKEFLYAFEKACNAYDFKNSLKLKISTQIVLQCLTAKNGNYDNYERLEFFGDSVLKFVCSKYLFLTKTEPLGYCVTKKDSLISNEALFEIAKQLNIPQYFSFMKFSDVLFQPPNLFKFLETQNKEITEKGNKFINFFNANRIFLSNNVSFQENKVKRDDDNIKGIKTFADIVEALIGAHFIEQGFYKSELFIHESGITKENKANEENILLYLSLNSAESDQDKTNNSSFPKNILDDIMIIKEMKEYHKILPMEEIKAIERILKYTFKHPGLIEKAMIHPSSHQNILGSINFNKLELLGDCALDLVVTEKIYNTNSELDPEGLHCARKSLVNNFSLARVLFSMKLDKYLHIGFSDDHMTSIKQKLQIDGESVNKAFGDVFESICGAILVDSDFDYYLFKAFIINNVYDVLVQCSDETR